MEHGILGEARAKAFLLERFWILERSVDIEGADYLIQRSINNQNFMDKEAPKLGVIQVKFIQDGNTYITINEKYICDNNGNPYNEFFLLVFHGKEDQAVSFILSSKEIVDTFTKKTDNISTFYKIRGSELLSSNFKINNKTLVLDKIEHALKIANFKHNRQFLYSTNYIRLNPDQIEYDLVLPLVNYYGDIREEFFKYKEELQFSLFDIEEVVEAINDILKSTDPEEAEGIYEKKISQHISRGQLSNLHFSGEFDIDEDLLIAVKNHKLRLQKIRELGLDNNYLNLIDCIKKTTSETVSTFDISKDLKVKITVTYNPKTLDNVNIQIESYDKYTEELPHIIKSSLGHHEIIFNPHRWFSIKYDLKKLPRPTDTSEIQKEFEKNSWYYLREFQLAIETILIGDEVDLLI